MSTGGHYYKCEERRVIDMPNCEESNPDDCRRSFHIYLPRIVCGDHGDDHDGGRGRPGRRRVLDDGDDDEDDIEPPSPHHPSDSSSSMIGTLPLVFGIHCYGCTTSSIDIFVDIANNRNMVMVLPEGLHYSFNARSCCGYALENDINDFGFLEYVISLIGDEYTFVRTDISYAVGWSNGGFMVMHAASLFRSISPISGYVNDIDPMLKHGTASAGGTGKGLFLHHGSDDPFVRPTGCCSDPDYPSCCCNIEADSCVSVADVARNWASEVNGCELAIEGSPPSLSTMDHRGKKIDCYTATGTECMSNTTICLHDASGHFNSPSFNDAFPFATEVMDFFARDACEIHGGKWNDASVGCTCPDDRGGTFCLDFPAAAAAAAAAAAVIDSKTVVEDAHDVKAVVIGCFLFALGVICFVRNRKRHVNKKTNGRYSVDESDQGIEEVTELVSSQTSRRLGTNS